MSIFGRESLFPSQVHNRATSATEDNYDVADIGSSVSVLRFQTRSATTSGTFQNTRRDPTSRGSNPEVLRPRCLNKTGCICDRFDQNPSMQKRPSKTERHKRSGQYPSLTEGLTLAARPAPRIAIKESHHGARRYTATLQPYDTYFTHLERHAHRGTG